MSEAEIARVLWAFRDRVHDLKNDIRFRYILLFKNHGAGAGGQGCYTGSPAIPNGRALR